MLRVVVPKNYFWAFLLTLLCAGCGRLDAGPAQFRIETNGQKYSDYVIRPSEHFSELHGGHADGGVWIVVSSGETLEIEMSKNQASNLTKLSVDAVHPEFQFTWTAVSLPWQGGPFQLPTVTPTRWSAYLAEHESVDYSTVIDHLERVRKHWVPAMGAEPGKEMRGYLPMLQQIVDSAAWAKKDESFFANELEAQTEMLRSFESTQRLSE